MLYSVIVYKFDGSEMTVIATINNLSSLSYARELEGLYQGKSINAYINSYSVGELV